MPPEGYASGESAATPAQGQAAAPKIEAPLTVAGGLLRGAGIEINLRADRAQFPAALVESLYRELQSRREKEIREEARKAAERREQEIVSINVSRAVARRLKEYLGPRGPRDFRGTELSGVDDSYVLYVAAKAAVV
jgi:hypothetical protein